ncbi:TPA: hypothetical protein ACIO4C_004402, partial [Salmonella enterica subsp. enterica serovar Virchow]
NFGDKDGQAELSYKKSRCEYRPFYYLILFLPDGGETPYPAYRRYALRRPDKRSAIRRARLYNG